MLGVKSSQRRALLLKGNNLRKNVEENLTLEKISNLRNPGGMRQRESQQAELAQPKSLKRGCWALHASSNGGTHWGTAQHIEGYL